MSSKKSITAASPMPTNISPRGSQAGEPIAAAFTSCGGRLTRSTLILQAAAMNVRSKKAAVKLPRIL